jgi:outer membrane protein assembly factor BamB
VDHQGFVLLAGATDDPTVVGLESFDDDIIAEAYVVKLTPQGRVLWSIVLPACGEIARPAVGPDDDVHVTCPSQRDSLAVGFPLTDPTGLVYKIDTDTGEIIWVQELSDPGTDRKVYPLGPIFFLSAGSGSKL